MILCAAQLQPIACNIEKNISKHLELIELAAANEADVIVFPELSITGYEPKYASELATDQNDPRFDVFQLRCEASHLSIGIGTPTVAQGGVRISMVLFQPAKPRTTYSKQLLHADELPYFICDEVQLIFSIKGHTLAPAICYESLQPLHGENAARLGADIYLASVAKSSAGVEKAHSHFPVLAKEHSMIVLMANSLGPCDDFVSAGLSAAWDEKGALIGKADENVEGILLLDADAVDARFEQLRGG